MKSSPRSAPEYCANCGAQLSPHARACPECGADERTGWREVDTSDGLDLPDPDDTATAHRAFEREQQGARPSGTRQWFWWAVGAVLLVVLIFSALGLR